MDRYLRCRPSSLLSLLAAIALSTLMGCSRNKCETHKRLDWPLAEQVAERLGDSAKLCSIDRSKSRFHRATLGAKIEVDLKSFGEMVAATDKVVATLKKLGFAQDPKRTHVDRIVTAPALPAKPYSPGASSGTLMRYLVSKDGTSAINVMAYLMKKQGYAVLALHKLEGPWNVVRRPAAGRRRLASFAAAIERARQSKAKRVGPPKSCEREPLLTVFRKPKVITWRLGRPLVLDAKGALRLGGSKKAMAISEFNLLDEHLGPVAAGYFAFYRTLSKRKIKGFREISSSRIGSGMRLARGYRTSKTRYTGEVKIARGDTGEIVYAGKITFDWRPRDAGLKGALKKKLGVCKELEVKLWDHRRARLEKR